MKKKLVIGALIAVLAVGMVMAFTACGANGSPESVVKASIESQSKFDVDAMLDLMYFEDSKDRETLKKMFNERLGEMGEISSNIKITKFECTVTDVTDEELETIKATYEGIDVQAASNCEYTASIEGTIKVSVGGVENEQDVSVEDEKGSVTVYKVGGKWYMAIIPAGQTDIGM
ncbi:MAG TPA: hypothetical protein H9692_06460 [Firmicutes bacterium]|nr:hypothetical protein [Bacillota bacterium]